MRRIGTECPKCQGSMILESDRLSKLVDRVCLQCGFTEHGQYGPMIMADKMIVRSPRLGYIGKDKA